MTAACDGSLIALRSYEKFKPLIRAWGMPQTLKYIAIAIFTIRRKMALVMAILLQVKLRTTVVYLSSLP